MERSAPFCKVYPLPNDASTGDGFNTSGYQGRKQKQENDAYIGRIDYNLTADGRHTIFWRGNLQND